MDTTQILIAVLAVTWLAGGAAIAIAMRRSGHDFGLWLALGVLLGPFAALFAQERHRLDRQRGSGRITELRTGPFDAVAGIDGSEESISAVQMALTIPSHPLARWTRDGIHRGDYIAPWETSASQRLEDVFHEQDQMQFVGGRWLELGYEVEVEVSSLRCLGVH